MLPLLDRVDNYLPPARAPRTPDSLLPSANRTADGPGSKGTDPTACWLLYARIGQSLVHMASVSLAAVMVRFSLFAVQVGLLVCWLWQFAQA